MFLLGSWVVTGYQVSPVIPNWRSWGARGEKPGHFQPNLRIWGQSTGQVLAFEHFFVALAPPGCSQQPGKYKVPFGITTDDTLVSRKEGHRKQGPRAPRTKSFGEMIHHNIKFQVRKFQCPVQNPKGTISPYIDVQDARTGRTGRTRQNPRTGAYRREVWAPGFFDHESSSHRLAAPANG